MAKKNKMKPRELREAQKKARQLKAAEINNNAVPAIAAMPAAEVIAPVAEKKKSSVKAAGMKSILVSKNKMYITSFGKGNSAVLEYEVDNNDYNKTQLSSKDNSNIELCGVNEVNITFSSKRGFESGVAQGACSRRTAAAADCSAARRSARTSRQTDCRTDCHCSADCRSYTESFSRPFPIVSIP